MRFFAIIFGLLILGIVGIIIYNWVRDEQERLGKRRSSAFNRGTLIPPGSSTATPLHPSIDPYLAELREFLLTPPLPQGPGEMAERVYTHLNQWVNTHLTEDALHNVDLESELLVEPTPRFVDMSRNDPVPPPGYLEDLMNGEQ